MLAYIVETLDNKIKFIKDVPVLQDFSDVFSKDLLGLPLERQLEFKSDLFLGVALIAKVPYRFAHTKMEELFTLLQELVDKGFIRPGSSPRGHPICLLKEEQIPLDVHRLQGVEKDDDKQLLSTL